MEAKKAGALVRAELDGYRSVRVQADLRKEWKKRIRKLPPAKREQWLKSQEGIAALGAQACHQILTMLQGRHSTLAASTCSDCWVDAWAHQGEMPPGLEFDSAGRLHGPVGTIETVKGKKRRVWPDGRRHAVRLVLSRVATSTGAELPLGSDPSDKPVCAKPTHRWTPPQAVALEDEIDRLNWWQAANKSMDWPASPSAVMIRLVGELKGTEVEHECTEVSKRKYKRLKAQQERQEANQRSH